MGRIITFLGPEHAGRTTIILNTAYLLAKEGSRVLIVDADQTRGRIRSHLSFDEKDIGLAEAACSLNPFLLEQCYIDHRKTGLMLLTLPILAKANELIGVTAAQAEAFFRRVSAGFDYVFVDTGNVLYEALSGYSLVCASKRFIVLPQEQRGKAWLRSMENILRALDGEQDTKVLNNTKILNNLYEIPELSITQFAEEKEIINFPYIPNMRDYLIARDLFMQNPSGKRVQGYRKPLQEVVDKIKE